MADLDFYQQTISNIGKKQKMKVINDTNNIQNGHSDSNYELECLLNFRDKLDRLSDTVSQLQNEIQDTVDTYCTQSESTRTMTENFADIRIQLTDIERKIQKLEAT